MRFIIILIGLLMCGSVLVSDQQIDKIDLKELEEFIAQRAISSLQFTEGTVLARVKNDFNTKDTPFRIWKYEAGKLKAGTMNDFKAATGDQPSEWAPFLYLFALKCVSLDAAQVEAWVIYKRGSYKETWQLVKKDQQWSIIKKGVTIQY
jgi:hypothetical protein